jgi:hypothetical protein
LKQVIEIEEQNVSTYFKPQLSKGSKKILEKKQETATVVHERLYSAKTERNTAKTVMT